MVILYLGILATWKNVIPQVARMWYNDIKMAVEWRLV